MEPFHWPAVLCVWVTGSKPPVQCTFGPSTDPFTAGIGFFHIRKGGVSLIRLLSLIFRLVLAVFHFVEIFFLSFVIGSVFQSISTTIVTFVVLSVAYYVVPVLSMTVAWGVAIFCMQYLYLHGNMASALMAGLALALVRFGLEKLFQFTNTKK
jgi:phosphotransferase system  glucose/maltose/N-acetylglucosamine-specific IIC component